MITFGAGDILAVIDLGDGDLDATSDLGSGAIMTIKDLGSGDIPAGVSSPASPWVPTELGTDLLLVWYDPSDDDYITFSGSDALALLDKSGNGNDSENALAAVAFTTINSVQALDYPGTATGYFYLAPGAASPVLGTRQIHSVIHADSDASFIMSHSSTAYFGVAANGVASTAIDNGVGNPSYYVDGVDTAASTRDDLHTAWSDDASPHIAGVVDLDLSASVWETIVRVWQYANPAFYLAGRVGDWLQTAGLSKGLRQRVEGYLEHKYSKSDLPIGHPFKASAPTLITGQSALSEIVWGMTGAGGSEIDAGPLGNDGSYSGTPVYNGSSVTFDGSSDALICDESMVLGRGAGWSVIIEGTSIGSQASGILFVLRSATQYIAAYNVGGNVSIWDGAGNRYPSVTWPSGDHDLAFVYDGATSLAVYVDGVLSGTATLTNIGGDGYSFPDGATFAIMASNTGTTQHLSGTIAHCELFPYALSGSQVTAEHARR